MSLQYFLLLRRLCYLSSYCTLFCLAHYSPLRFVIEQKQKKVYSQISVPAVGLLSMTSRGKVPRILQDVRMFAATTNYELTINVQRSADEMLWKKLNIAFRWQIFIFPEYEPDCSLVLGSYFTMRRPPISITVIHLLTFTMSWSFACVNHATL
jgi:hypothetical protein